MNRRIQEDRLSAKEAIFREHDEAEKKIFTMLKIVIVICTVAIIIVWTGYVWNLSRLSKDDAETIVDLDQGKYMLDTARFSNTIARGVR